MEEKFQSLQKLACGHGLPVQGRMQNFKTIHRVQSEKNVEKPKKVCFWAKLAQNLPKTHGRNVSIAPQIDM